MSADSKKEIRILMNRLKEKIAETDQLSQSHAIFKKIEGLQIFQQAKYILLYWSMDNEVSTHHFVSKWKDRKIILLPAISEDTLILKKYTGRMKSFRTSTMTLFEPVGKQFNAMDKIDLAIVPGLAFDQNNNRLGHGKGYYDKLLKDMHAFKIGIGFGFQKIQSLPASEHDIKMDLVLTSQDLESAGMS